MVCMVAKNCEKEILVFEDFVKLIIGEPDNYTFSSFYELIKSKDLQYFLEHPDEVVLTRKNQIGKMGEADYSFSIIGKGLSIDNIIIDSLLSPKL
jgi:hypothetical protein